VFAKENKERDKKDGQNHRHSFFTISVKKLLRQNTFYHYTELIILKATQTCSVLHRNKMAMKGAHSQSSGKPKYDPKKRKFQNKKSSADDNLSPANKKRALKHERQSHRKHASSVQPAKELWNQLRVKTNDKETNIKLCAELHELLKGKCLEVAMQHDASRCVQGVLQYGTEQMRLEVVKELCGADAKKDDDTKNQNVNLAELCKIQYAHFVVLKMIKYGSRDEECIKLIVKVSSSFLHVRCVYIVLCIPHLCLMYILLTKEFEKANDQISYSLRWSARSRTTLWYISSQISCSVETGIVRTSIRTICFG